MLVTSIRGRRWGLAAAAAVLLAAVAALWLKSTLEHAARARIEAAAVRQGMVARIGAVRVGIWPLLRLTAFDLEARHGVRWHADVVDVTWLGHLRLAIRRATFSGPAGISIHSPESTWNAGGLRGRDVRFTLVDPHSGLAIRKHADASGSTWSIEAHELEARRLFDVRRNGQPLVDGGTASGRMELVARRDALRFHVDMGARGARLAALADSTDDTTQLGDPTDVTLRLDGSWQRSAGTLAIPAVVATVAGATLTGSFALLDLRTNPAVDLDLGVQRLDFAQLLGTSGLAVPESLGMPAGGAHGLGSATIEVRVRGRLDDPAALAVSQKIDFDPPAQLPPAIARLRGAFSFTPDDGHGPGRPIDVSPASPDFIALRDVPPLFVRTLLLAEDASFYGHRGIDLRELPTALVTNWTRGGAARGASTITQQLAKNLFLSRDKQLGRKLQELAITFLLESALGKSRILEIYLNIIEWGPGLHGLRPAARRYFDREPQALTPAQMAFLVAIIPGPIKYQASFAHGLPGPGLQVLIDDLLAKLASVDAISAEEYHRALLEPIIVGAVN